MTFPSLAPGPALAGALILALAAIRFRRVLLFVLPFLVVLNGVPLGVGGMSVRVDQVAACLLVLPLVLSALARVRAVRIDPTTWWLGGLLAMNVLSSMLYSPARAYSLLQCANLASAWVIYPLLVNWLDTRAELMAFLVRCLWAGAVGSGIGIAAFALAAGGVPVGGAEASPVAAESLTRAFGAYGTMLEPNIFGSFTGAVFILAAGLHAAGTRGGTTVVQIRLLRATAALSAVGVVLSFTRAAWLGVFAGAVVLLALGRRTIRLRAAGLGMPVALALTLVVLLLVVPGTTGGFLRFKFINLVNLESRTATLRLLTYAMAIDQTTVHPFVGWGTFTFAPLVAQGTDFARFDGWRNLWITNFLLLALHDTGVIGCLMWIGMLWSLLRRAVVTAWRVAGRDPELASRLVALTAMAVTLVLPFLATTGFSLGYPWLLLGLLGAHVRLAGDPSAA